MPTLTDIRFIRKDGQSVDMAMFVSAFSSPLSRPARALVDVQANLSKSPDPRRSITAIERDGAVASVLDLVTQPVSKANLWSGAAMTLWTHRDITAALAGLQLRRLPDPARRTAPLCEPQPRIESV